MTESATQPLELPAKEQRPQHVAIIMDGNGRWAKHHGLTRAQGHRRGAEVVREVTTFCRELEIKYLTLFSFSVQNWSRPEEEVGHLMHLLEDYCDRERQTLMDNGIRLTTIGRLERLPSATQKALRKLTLETANNQMMTLTLAVDYGSREEIVAAAKRIAAAAAEGSIDPQAITEEFIGAQLSTQNMPDPDLVIRTSGELRISNFLLWQIAYAELYFADVPWPAFSRQDFVIALQEYANRERRFGAVPPSA